MRPFSFALLSAALLSGSLSAKADAVPYPNVGTVAPTTIYTASDTGTITGYFVQGGKLSGGGELFTDSIRLLDLTSGTQTAWLFNSQTTTTGTTASFGSVTKGDTLVFEVLVKDLTGTLSIFSSDPALSADGDNHAYLTQFAGGLLNGSLFPAGLYAGMEDTNILTNNNPGNLDYVDLTAVFQNVTATPAPSPTPEPTSLVLLGTGILGAAGAVRRKLTR